MSDLSTYFDSIRRVFQPTQHGVVGLVDNLLGLSQGQDLQIEWQDGRCRVRALGAEPEEFIEVPLPKSVFRAVLARLATLCNQHDLGSTSPYGGEGELAIGGDPPTVCRVEFTNTLDVQRVQLVRIDKDAEESPSRSGKSGAIVGSRS